MLHKVKQLLVTLLLSKATLGAHPRWHVMPRLIDRGTSKMACNAKIDRYLACCSSCWKLNACTSEDIKKILKVPIKKMVLALHEFEYNLY